MTQRVTAAEAARRTGSPCSSETVDLDTVTTVPGPGALSLPDLTVVARGIF